MNSFLIVLYAIFLFGGAVGGILFPIVYTITSKWWHSKMGVNVFLFSSLFALLYARGSIQFFNPASQELLARQSFGSAVFILSITMLGAFVVWQRLYVLRETIREDNEQKRKEARDVSSD